MDSAFEIAWWLWCPIAALLVQSAAVRVFKPKSFAGFQAVGCLGWLISFCLAMLLVSFSGLQFYGLDPQDRWQLAGWFVLFISPIGLPMAFGAPVVLVVQTILNLWKSRGPAR